VHATDPGGNVDASPATRTFRVDTQAPDTTIRSAPPYSAPGTTATLTFDADEPGGSFECRLDWQAWTDCASPKTYTGLSIGRHWVSVRAIDAAGNVDASPDWSRWRTEGS
jgi:large repetitive protein